MCSNEIKIEKAGEEMAHKLKTIRADMLMLQYQLERELIRYVKRYLAQPRTTLITEDEQFAFMCELYDYFPQTPAHSPAWSVCRLYRSGHMCPSCAFAAKNAVRTACARNHPARDSP